MGTHVVDGLGLAAELKGRLAAEVTDFMEAGVVPGLATVLVGSPAEAEAYERRVRKLADELGYRYACERLPIDAEEAEVIATVGKLKSDPRVSGILVLKPLPDHVSEAAVYRALDPLKDIEAVHPVNAGLLALGRPRYVPSTPAAAFHMLDRYLVGSGRDPAEFYPSSNVVFVGRSNNVGKPAVSLGFLRNATVISCDEHAHNAGRQAEFTKQADVLIVAAGVPGLIKKEHVREGVIAIDVGINSRRDPPHREGKLRGRPGLRRCRDHGRRALARARWGRPDHRRLAPQEHRRRPGLHPRRGNTALAGAGRRGEKRDSRSRYNACLRPRKGERIIR